MRFLASLALLALTATALPTRADEPAPEKPVDTLGASLKVDLPITLAAAAFWFGTEGMKSKLAPATCRVCDPNGLDDSLAHGVRWANRDLPATISDVGVFGVMPLFALGGVALAANHDGKLEQAGWDVLLVAEAASIAQVANQATKFVVGRERPFVHWLSGADKMTVPTQPSDNNLSFFSGHTTFSFALVTGAYSVSRMRGYSWANGILAIGLPMATGVAYLRMAAGKHYFTDVTVGALVGSAAGLFIPALHRWEAFKDGPKLAVAPLEGGGLAMATWDL